MRKIEFKEAAFVKTALLPKDYPLLKQDNGKPMPEIAVIGRSNVGKSSLLNFLFQSRGLVKTSQTPGKTQAINFFTCDKKVAFVDLPGYGYAQAGKEAQKRWAEAIELYLRERKELSLFLFLLDIRRVPTGDDLQMLEFLLASSLPFILVFTKVDKVSLAERSVRTQAILDTLGEGVIYVHTSASKRIGRMELITAIVELLHG